MSNPLQKKETMKVPEPTLRRLPWYLSNVKLLKQKGERFVSSTQISKEINIDASQIAKDLSYVNISGRTRVGYEVDTLIAVLEDFLGFTNIHKAFLFGVGSLGGALLRDSGLSHFGLEIVAAFDVKPELVGTTLSGIPHLSFGRVQAEDAGVRCQYRRADGAYRNSPADNGFHGRGRYQGRMEFHPVPYPCSRKHCRAEHFPLCPSGRDV